MAVNVLDDLSTSDGRGNGGVVILESDELNSQLAFAELQHQDARAKAQSHAVTSWGMQKVGVSGMSMHPYGVDDGGKTFEDFKATDEKPHFTPYRYRMDVPVQGNNP